MALLLVLQTAPSEALDGPAEDLIRAIDTHNVEGVTAALASGASPRSTYNYGIPVLYKAAGKGNLEIVKILVGKGASIKDDSVKGDNSPLHIAALCGHRDIVEYFIAMGVPVDSRDSKGRTALMLAARGGHVGTVKLLIDKGADINVRDINGATPLVMAQVKKRKEVVMILTGAGAK